MKNALIIGAVIAALIGGYFWKMQKPAPNVRAVEVIQPELTTLARAGEAVFQGTCAACHGADLTGTEQGRPLLHPYYRSNHHSDFSIVRAVQIGVPAHHWRFGAMPAQPQISDEDIVELTAYIREFQRANGIM